MIIDSLDRLKDYASLHPRFATVCRYLDSIDLLSTDPAALPGPAALPDGRYTIEGDDIFMTVASGLLRSNDEAPLEVHDKFIDIQIVLPPATTPGSESFGWRPRAACLRPRDSFNTADDILFYYDTPQFFIPLTSGQFAIFFPDDAHAPLIGEGPFRKCIVKVRA